METATKDLALKRITELVDQFIEGYDNYKKTTYDEAKTRGTFIDEFFSALGWDIHNKEGLDESYRDVIPEDKIKVEGRTKAPDYCFTIHGQRKFFVEAKKPSVPIKTDNASVFQLRRYGYHNKLPISIIANFEEFAIYDCTKKPFFSDKTSVGRIWHINYNEYVKEIDFLWNIFSKESVLKGRFDKFVKSDTEKRGTSTVDTDFLVSLNEWRKYLATSIAKNNHRLTQEEVQYVVQQTIDRIIFLIFCEYKKIESWENLKSITKKGNLYKNLFELFNLADKKYNSGLFDFHKDQISEKLTVDNKVIDNIIFNLYPPNSDYDFSILPVEVLGIAYEQFLGKIIRITPGHIVKIEDKPEVKKAGGVFYTPQYIVDYIVKNTVGKLIHGKTPEQISIIKIVDPACGSGSFLLGAYQFLLNYHNDYYLKNGFKEKKIKNNPLTPEGRLTTEEKRKILINNIFGVDIDRQAVEVTKLSLLLKAMEGETDVSIKRQLQLIHERVLPNIDGNIKCGNSLINHDFFDEQLELDKEGKEELKKKINPFDWRSGFTEIFKRGGFDCVIGNPPYGYMISKEQQIYFEHNYYHQDYQKDLYLLFLERYQHILKENGTLGVIISNTWLQSLTLKKIRSYLLHNYKWNKMLLLPEKVFDAVVDTHVIIFQKETPRKNNSFIIEILKDSIVNQSHTLIQSEITTNGDTINVSVNKNIKDIFEKICRNKKKLSETAIVYNGVKPFEKGKGTPPQTQRIVDEKPFVAEGKMPGKKWSPLLRGSLIHRYINLWNKNYWIRYGDWLAAPRDPNIFKAKEKIMIRQTSDSLIATIIPRGYIGRNNLHIILPFPAMNIKYLLGLLNSKLMDFVYTFINPEKGEALAEVKKQHVEILPVKEINLKNKIETSLQSEIIKRVDNLLQLNKDIRKTRTSAQHEQIQNRISYSENRIDELVFNLYGLSKKDIETIKSNLP